MNAKAIADMRTSALEDIGKADKDGQDYGIRLHTFYMVAEVALQFAEANERLAKIANPLIVVNAESEWVWFESREGFFGKFPIKKLQVRTVVKKHCAKVPSQYMDAGRREDLADIVIVLRDGSEYAVADGTVAGVCKKLGIPVEAASAG